MNKTVLITRAYAGGGNPCNADLSGNRNHRIEKTVTDTTLQSSVMLSILRYSVPEGV